MSTWDKLTPDERLHMLACRHPFDYLLSPKPFREAAAKAWTELTAHEQERWGAWAESYLYTYLG